MCKCDGGMKPPLIVFLYFGLSWFKLLKLVSQPGQDGVQLVLVSYYQAGRPANQLRLDIFFSMGKHVIHTQMSLCMTEDLPVPQTLQEVEIPVVGSSQCSCQYKNVKGLTITPQMICAGRTSKGICQVSQTKKENSVIKSYFKVGTKR